ncbi:MAG: hypothetical protein JST88_00630 [Bacteroidetes bacterium]|nr:hypothetical protein [Bacteroidota bacterium]
MKNVNENYSKILSYENAAFVLDESKFEKNIKSFLSSFQLFYPKTIIGYSYKTNYLPRVCQIAHGLGCYAEVVSSMEVEMATAHLQIPQNIIFNGPVKTVEALQKVVELGGIINIDNYQDIQFLDQILTNKNLRARVALRLNRDFDGHPSRFGIANIDIDSIKKHVLSNPQYDLIGFHLHLPFRSVESFEYRVKEMILELDKHNDVELKYINLGGGFFGNLEEVLAASLGIQNPPTYNTYAKIIGQALFDYFKSKGLESLPELFLEPGSSVVADVFTFISRIHTKKTIENRNYLVTYCGRHLVSPTNKTSMLPIELKCFSEEKNEYNKEQKEYLIVGYTCIEGDILGMAKETHVSNKNSYILIKNVGSYSVVMGSDFILPQPPIYTIKSDGKLEILRKRKSAINVIESFVK